MKKDVALLVGEPKKLRLRGVIALLFSLASLFLFFLDDYKKSVFNGAHFFLAFALGSLLFSTWLYLKARRLSKELLVQIALFSNEEGRLELLLILELSRLPVLSVLRRIEGDLLTRYNTYVYSRYIKLVQENRDLPIDEAASSAVHTALAKELLRFERLRSFRLAEYERKKEFVVGEVKEVHRHAPIPEGGISADTNTPSTPMPQ